MRLDTLRPRNVKPCVCGHPTNRHAAIWNTGRRGRGKCDVPGCGCTTYERPEAAKEDAA